jgi:hypothetical protein
MTKKILLVSNVADDASFLAEVCAAVQAELHIAADAGSAVTLLAQNDFSAVFVDVSELSQLREFEFEVQKRFGLFSDRIQPNAIHFVSAQDLSQNRETILSPLFGNFYQRPAEAISESGQYYGRFVLASEKMATHDLRNFLQTEKVMQQQNLVQQVVLSHTDQKQEAVEAVRQYLIAAKVPARVSNLIANSVDELLMNAMFDAPVDQFGKPLYSSTHRSHGRPLVGREQVTMRVGFDGFYFGISVADAFGSIDRSRLLQHISASYREQDYTIRSGQAGAGLGVATIFNSGGSLIYHCESNKRTEATVLYRAYASYRDVKNQFRFFSAKFYG